MASNAQYLFEQIMSAPDKAAYLRAMVGAVPPTFEEEWLDFKAGLGGPPTALVPLKDEKIKELWSTALTGFANTGGGVLIWGIDARATPSPADPNKKVDAASDLRFVPNPDAFKSQLMALHHMATDPPVGGVLIEPINDPAGGGFVVCLVPESNFKPHRAEYVKNKPYYIRAGDDFVVAAVSLLRAMFHPRSKPYLRVQVRFVAQGSQSAGVEIRRWIFRIYNTGTATARDLNVSVQTRAALQSHAPGPGCSKGDLKSETGFTIYCDRPVHPGTSRDVLTADEKWSSNSRWGKDTEFAVYMYASDHEPQAAHVRFTYQDYVNGDPKLGTPIAVEGSEGEGTDGASTL